VAVVAVLFVQVGRSLGKSEAERGVEAPEDASVTEGKPLSIRATAPVRVLVEVDGLETYSGVLCRDLECRLDVAAAREIAVELADLSRASVIYNGSRVAPLGNLSAPRRLVFVDDAD